MPLLPVSIPRALSVCDIRDHLDDDLIVATFDTLTMPYEERLMTCTFVGLIHSGSGSYTVGEESHSVSSGDVIIIPEGQVLGDVTIADDFHGDILLISHTFLYDVIREVRDVTNLFVFSREHPVFHLTEQEVTMFREYLAVLRIKLADERHAFRRQIAGTLLATMIYDLMSVTARTLAPPAPQRTKAQETFERFMALVAKNYKRERRVGWYAERLCLTPKTLLETVKRVSSRTPNEWLDTYTVLELRRLLRHTTRPIKDIAEMMTFASQSSLGKFFREHVGVSPKAYRNG